VTANERDERRKKNEKNQATKHMNDQMMIIDNQVYVYFNCS